MNLPDDYGMSWTRCRKGHRFHMSDGGCDICIDAAARNRTVDMTKMVCVRYENGEFLYSKVYSPDHILMVEGQIGLPLLFENKIGKLELKGMALYNSVEQAEEMMKYGAYDEEKIIIVAPKS